MGEDCAGAVRFIRPEKINGADSGGKKEISEKEIERRLRELRKDPAMGREPQDRGQFSLAGAQSKTALQRRGDKWYIPWGREPTTHILKPSRADIDMITEMAGTIPKAAKTVKAELVQQGIRHSVLGQLVKGIYQRAETTLKNFGK